jgi:Zn finger protein HypA/HybF involved in hydrogenase expression
MKDKVITCMQCQNEFVFSAAEQERFLARGFDFPKRCPQCRDKKAKLANSSGRRKGEHRKKPRRRRFDDDEW